MGYKDPGSRRRTLMVAGGFSLLAAAVIEPGLLSHLSSCPGTVAAGLVVVLGFLGARGIRRLAVVFLREKAAPWYVRPGAGVFLCIAMPCMNVLFVMTDGFFFNTGIIGQVTSQQARMFVFMASELLWIAWLD